jgi:hypothetical protein
MVNNRLAIGLGLAVALICLPLALHADGRTPQVMILGTYHMANSNRNVVKNAMRDTLAPDRQREIAKVVETLARFRPTIIALEVEPERAAEIQASYREFVDGRRQLTAKETEQLGFRLGKAAGLKSFCLFDYQNAYNYPAVVAFLRKNRGQEALARLEADNARAGVAAAERDRKFSVAQQLAWGNSDPVLRAMHWSELFMIDAADERESPGPALLALWYERNLRMFSRMRGCITKPDDRLLVIVGWGHAKILRDLVRDSVDLTFVSPLPYLPEPPPPVNLPAGERIGLFKAAGQAPSKESSGSQ